jgi:hypothetical protein
VILELLGPLLASPRPSKRPTRGRAKRLDWRLLAIDCSSAMSEAMTILRDIAEPAPCRPPPGIDGTADRGRLRA